MRRLAIQSSLRFGYSSRNGGSLQFRLKRYKRTTVRLQNTVRNAFALHERGYGGFAGYASLFGPSPGSNHSPNAQSDSGPLRSTSESNNSGCRRISRSNFRPHQGQRGSMSRISMTIGTGFPFESRKSGQAGRLSGPDPYFLATPGSNGLASSAKQRLPDRLTAAIPNPFSPKHPRRRSNESQHDRNSGASLIALTWLRYVRLLLAERRSSLARETSWQGPRPL